MVSRAALLLPLVAALACAPRLKPLAGSSVRPRLPASRLPAGYRKVVFKWELYDRDFDGRGEGAARVASPDSARVDFFLAGGVGSGVVVLIDTLLRLPDDVNKMASRLIPSPSFLWGALGRASVPALRDTVARVDGDTLRADIGNPVAWRLTYARDVLVRVERVVKGRVAESVTRFADGRVHYRDVKGRRRLELTVTRTDRATAFDASIWNP